MNRGLGDRAKRLNAYAELDILCLVARVRIKVIRRPAIEFVALTNLAANHHPHGQRSYTRGYPSDIAQEGAALMGRDSDRLLDLFAEFAERA
jgi:hypothetical protein